LTRPGPEVGARSAGRLLHLFTRIPPAPGSPAPWLETQHSGWPTTGASVTDHGEDDRPRYLFYDPVTDERREGLTEEEALILL